MAKPSSTMDPLLADIDKIFQPSDAAFAEELQLEEMLKWQPSDASYAEELQLQEALKISLTTPQVTSDKQKDPFVQETGESSSSFCEICMKKKENEQMFSKEICLDCIADAVSEDLKNIRPEPDTREKKRLRNFWDESQIASTSREIPSAATAQGQDPKGKSKEETRKISKTDDGWFESYRSEPKEEASSYAAESQHPKKFSPMNTSKVDSKNRKDEAELNTNSNIVEDDGIDDFLDDSSEYDSDTSQKSLATLKNNRVFMKFFEELEGLNIEEIKTQNSSWHCPACQGGPGGPKRFQCLEDLKKHAKTIGSRRVKLHKQLAELLDEELRKKGIPFGFPDDKILGRWKGLEDEAKDFEIVWPPMVMILNTNASQDNDKWLGMGSQELHQQFRSYNVMKAISAYGPNGHRGSSILIFEGSAVGYLEAKQLHEGFEKQGKGRVAAYGSSPALVLPTGERQLYGFMAAKEDLEVFNQHNQGECRVKYQIRTYQEAVLNPVRKMSEDSQELTWIKQKLEEEENRAKFLEKSLQILNKKLQLKTKDNRLLLQKMKLLHKENLEQLNFQEIYFKEQISNLEENVPKED